MNREVEGERGKVADEIEEKENVAWEEQCSIILSELTELTFSKPNFK